MSLHVDSLNLSVRDGVTTRHLLNDVSLHVESGEVLGVSGPSGSGKSTLLGVLGCLQPADSGRALLNTPQSRVDLGARMSGTQAAALRRSHIGIVFQQPNLLPALSVIEQLLIIPRLGRVLPLPAAARHRARSRAEELLDAVRLADFARRRVGELSGGQQARVNLARALMNEPDLLLVDEPTAALDTRTAGEVTALIVEMTRSYRAATLYVSHDPEQMKALDHQIELIDGRVLNRARV